MLVDPMVLEDVIESIPGMVENCRSRGVATEAAIISGLAPGRLAFTCIVGKSTLGRSLTGRMRYPTTPKIMIPSITSVVMTGRRMKISVMFIAQPLFTQIPDVDKHGVPIKISGALKAQAS
jgi:hypothetical protein